MNLTVGPHPPAVYWRRRAVVGAPILLILTLFTSCLAGGGSATSGASRTGVQRAGAATSGAGNTAANNSAAQSQHDCTRDNPCEPVIGGAPSAGAAALPASPSTPPLLIAPAPSASAGKSDDDEPKLCADGDIELTVQSDKASYRAGTMPRFTMMIVNSSDVPCRRDVGASHQELRVLAGSKRVWSSDDCSPNRGDDLVTLKPGEKRKFWLTWSARTSAPGCPKTRTLVGAGTYQLVGRLEKLTSVPRAFTVVR